MDGLILIIGMVFSYLVLMYLIYHLLHFFRKSKEDTKKVYFVNKDSGEPIVIIDGFDFIPRKDECVILDDYECVVDDIVYTDNNIYIFVVKVSPHYIKLIPRIF